MGQLPALAITIAVELVVAMLLATAVGWVEREDRVRLAIAVVAASLLTHPVAWWASHYGLAGMPRELKVVGIELAVVLLETIVLRVAVPLRWGRAVGLAALFNAASYGVGLMLVGR